MSQNDLLASDDSNQVETTSKKRKADQAELEVDLNAPEPPSKKALRKAKKTASGPQGQPVKKEAETDEGSAKRSAYGIWIGNLSFTTTKEDLLSFITSDLDHSINKEQVTRINLPSSGIKFGKPQNRGFAYVDFSDAESLASALELSEKLLTGRRVLIKDAKSFEGRPSKSNANNSKEKDDETKPPSRRIFIGNLDFTTSVEDLESHFGVCGTITHTHMATFEDTGKCKGFAWVEFENVDDARKAMRGWVEEGHSKGAEEADATEQQGGRRSSRRIWLQKIHGRKLRMEYAEDKAVRYQKRYGKEGQKTKVENGDRGSNQDSRGEHGSGSGQDGASNSVDGVAGPAAHGEQGKGNKKRRIRTGGYDEATVGRLTGGIVDAKGSKKTFD